MFLILFSFLLIINRIDTRFLFNSGSSSILVSRLIRLPTDDDEYRIRCPYNLNYILIISLNYSNLNCFELNSISINEFCSTHRSPCRFQARPIRLNCHDHQYSSHVDITYQCSFSPITLTRSTTKKQIQVTSPIPLTTTIPPNTAVTFSLKRAESMAFFLIGIGIIFILWLFACCIWFVYCGHTFDTDDGKCELLAHRPYHISEEEMIDFDMIPEERNNLTIVGSLAGHTSTGGLENLCLRINPFDENHLSLTYISSLRTTRTDR